MPPGEGFYRLQVGPRKSEQRRGPRSFVPCSDEAFVIRDFAIVLVGW